MKPFVVVLIFSLISIISLRSQNPPVITSFSQNGGLVCSNLQPGTIAHVEWASSLAGPWHTDWAGPDAITVNSNTTISVNVPMFYRVRGMAYIPPTTPDGMALVPAGSFTMGNFLFDGNSATNDPDITDANPTNIYVSEFYMDTNLVSYGQWKTVYNWAATNGYSFDYSGSGKATNNPVQTITWQDGVKWCNARSQRAGLAPVYFTDAALTRIYTNGWIESPYVNGMANGYRLPTEAEWEKAARGGLNGQRFPWGNTISQSQANYYGNTAAYNYDLGPDGFNPIGIIGGTYPSTTPVGTFAPNGFGLYDMAGNTFVWCWDYYGTPYGQPSTNNPTGPIVGSYRVIRGDSWGGDAYLARCAKRAGQNTSSASFGLGIRCVRRP